MPGLAFQTGLPKLIRFGLPAGGVAVALGAEMIRAFRKVKQARSGLSV